MPPLVSVVMSAYNGEKYVAGAVESILSQTLGDFEFIIVDDGSTDGTPQILARYQRADARIKIHTHPRNQGIVASANDGCRLVSGAYIARIDADDCCAPDRLEKQVSYLEQHPEIGMLGTWFRVIDQHDRLIEIQCPPTLPGVIEWTLLCSNCFCNSSVIMRRDVVEQAGYYRREAQYGTEDYDLFVRLSRVTRLENLPEVLCTYRFWNGNISNIHAERREQFLVKVVREAVSAMLGEEISQEEAMYLRSLTGAEGTVLPTGLTEIGRTATLLKRLYDIYRQKTNLKSTEIRAVSWSVAYRLYLLSRRAARHSIRRALSLRAQAFGVNPYLALTIDARKLVRRTLANR